MEFPDLGEHCSDKRCNRLDYLALKCDACEAIFCKDHIYYVNHSCPSAYKKDVQVPVCPLCNAPVPSKRGDAPDVAVGQHIDNDCKSDYGISRQKVFANKCSTKGCKNKEIVPVTCKDCGMNFCLKHRHPPDHSCLGKEEAMRLKRLSALNRATQPTSSANNSSSFRNLQGTLSEDEALARALQASLQDQQQPAQPVPWNSRYKCTLS